MMNCHSRNHLVNRTSVFCFQCGASHQAEIHRQGDRVVGKVACPVADREVELSSNAEMFLAIRAKSRRISSGGGPGRVRSLINLLSITDNCNFHCPVCYAASGPKEDPAYLPVENAIERVRSAKKLGAKRVVLSGGEPTLHPHLQQVVSRIRKLGLGVLMATNGQRLAEDPGYVGQLRKSGLGKVNLQFDTLDKVVHQQLRGNTRVDEKIQAARNVIAVGLRLGLTTTVTRLNLKDLGDIVTFGLSLAPSLNTIVFQAACTAGRYALPESTLIDRESIIEAVLQSDVLPAATTDDVWPLPSFRPWGMRVHPDCGANLILTVNDGKCDLLPRILDLDALYRRMGRNTMKQHWIARNLVPLRYMLSSVQQGKRVAFLKCLAGFLFGDKRHGAVVIGMGSFPLEGFWDEQRVANCASSELTEDGPISPCIHYSPIENHSYQPIQTTF